VASVPKKKFIRYAYLKSPASARGPRTPLIVSSSMIAVTLISIKPFQSNAQLASTLASSRSWKFESSPRTSLYSILVGHFPPPLPNVTAPLQLLHDDDTSFKSVIIRGLPLHSDSAKLAPVFPRSTASVRQSVAARFFIREV
jgi:hypothetical protein